MKNGLLELPGKIADEFTELFIPDEGAFSELKEKIKSIYLIDQAMQLRNKFNELWHELGFYGVPDKAPEITFTVSTIGTKSLAQFEKDIRISLDWYAPYKADVDVFLSALMLLFYGFRTFTNLPAIINGTGGPFSSLMRDMSKGGKD